MKERQGRFLTRLRFITSASSTLKQSIAVHQKPKLQESKNKDLLDFNFGHKSVELEPDPGSKESQSDDRETQLQNCFCEFEEKCPPGGEDSVIFYTTSLRGIRETADACNKIRFLLESSKVVFHERDVSMDLGFRQEMRSLVGIKSIPPRLFIKGRHIGGAEEVLELNDTGKFKKLLEGIPLTRAKCEQCRNQRFSICRSCNGSSKVFVEEDGDEMWRRCTECNENGLVKCPICN